MSRKDKIIEDIKEGYYPTWEGSPKKDKIINDVSRLYRLPQGSKEYFKLKAEVIGYLGRNCIEELSRGKDGQGMLTRIIFDDLTTDLWLERENGREEAAKIRGELQRAFSGETQ
jgi:hypothetical protein